jgi:hypothetical protein
MPEQAAVKDRLAQQEQDSAERKRQLEKTLSQNQSFRRRSDEISAAQALHDLLVRIKKERGIPIAKILGEAGIDPRKQTDYAIRKDLSPEKLKRLSDPRNETRLRKRTDPLKRIVDAVGRLTGDDVGDLYLEVFGPPVEFRAGATQEPDGGGFEELASRLRFVAAAVSARFDLSKYFRDVERAGVSPSLVEEGPDQTTRKEIVIKFSSDNKDTDGIPAEWYLLWPIELGQFTWVCGFEEAGDLPAYPMVILGAWEVGSPFPVSVAQKEKSAEGRPVVVLSFCIVPTGKARSATPVLQVDLCASIAVLRSTGGWATGWAPLRPGTVAVGEYKINIEEVPKLSSPFTAADIERHASASQSATRWSRPDILFLPINDIVCRNWFKKFQPGETVYPHYDRPIPHPDLGPPLCEDFGLVAPFSPFGADTLAGIVDAALCTGHLDWRLEEQAKRLTEAFEAADKTAADERERNWKKVKERLEES